VIGRQEGRSAANRGP